MPGFVDLPLNLEQSIATDEKRAGDDERVIYQYTPAQFRIEDFMAEHHSHLVVNLCDVGGSCFAGARGVQFAFLGLYAKVKDMKCRQRVLHSYVSAVFQCLVFVSGRSYAMESKLPKKRQ